MASDPDRPPVDPARDPYRELFERSADAILIIEEATFVDCNDAAVRMLRYSSKEEVLQTHPSALSPKLQPDGRESFEKANEIIALAFERGSHRFEWDHRRADGEVFPVEVLLTAIQEPGRRTLHVVWRDITERKLLEEELRQAQKMEAIGKLTGGIAHDFNNLLVTVLGNADLLADELHDRPQEREYALGIRDAGERAADLVRQLLAFGRKQQLLPSVLDLNLLISDMRQLLERLLGEQVELVLELAPEAVWIKADRSQMEQILLNLAANARDAMSEGGRLTVVVSRTHLDGSQVGAEHELPIGEYASLVFADTGCGMDPETAARAFDPFFTTKDVGHGSGLGLATVYGIVKQSGGSVSLQGAPGQGMEVAILLPLSLEAPATVDPEPKSVPSSAAGGETILVAEDEAAVSGLIGRVLAGRGYKVLSAMDGVEALRLYREHHEDIALIVTDVIMPELGGPGLVTELELLGHSPRVLFMSGYTDEGLTALHGEYHAVDILTKPFDVSELVRRVDQALER